MARAAIRCEILFFSVQRRILNSEAPSATLCRANTFHILILDAHPCRDVVLKAEQPQLTRLSGPPPGASAKTRPDETSSAACPEILTLNISASWRWHLWHWGCTRGGRSTRGTLSDISTCLSTRGSTALTIHIGATVCIYHCGFV